VICPYCRKEFVAKDAKKECQSCSSFGGCQKVKCPFCGYESPREPEFIENLRVLKKKFGRNTDENK
jgi:hypothetical protein